MSFIPALVALVSMCIVWFYPLTTERITQINTQLKELRSYYRDVDEND
jgi:GPH family glycoside/pentoside/hexuronide:cation symporter